MDEDKVGGTNQPAPAREGYFYIVMQGGVSPIVSDRFTSADERDAEVEKIFNDEDDRPVEYDEATDTMLKMNIDGDGMPEVWSVSRE